jgi:putative endonuclease
MFKMFRRWFSPAAPESFGDRGERIASEWLRRHRNFVLVAANWRNPHDRRDEIDLVCRDAELLVFVEVKSRTAGGLVPGYYAVDRRKKRALRRGIMAYLAGLRKKPPSFRFDIVEVNFPQLSASRVEAAVTPEILHFENVPLFSKSFRA